MPEYGQRDFKSTMEALVGPDTARVAPVSRYADVNMGKIVRKIVWAQSQVGIPDEETIQRLMNADTSTKEGLKKAYEDVEFHRGTRPLKVIEVCYEPKTPETMRKYFESACRHRDEQDPKLKVLIGTIQNRERFEYMIGNGCLPDGVVSTNMAPLRDGFIKYFCREHGIVLGPNIGYSSDNLVECLASRKFDASRNVISGAAIQKTFPFGSIKAEDFLEAFISTHPEALLMPTGGVSETTTRNLIRKGAALVGASAPAKKDAIVNAAHEDIVRGVGESAWDDFIRGASIMATEAYIGFELRKIDKTKARGKEAELNRKFAEVVSAFGEV